MSSAKVDAWARYWTDAARARGGGCLPAADGSILEAQKEAWRGVVKRTPRAARVLDIATGDGAVLRHLLALRPDLKLVGVDSSPALPDAPKGCKVRAGVVMERLPFGDGSFALVTSQFGFEYGQIDATAKQIGRVLAPGGTAALLVHRGDGPILRRNLDRRGALEWVIHEREAVRIALAAAGSSARSSGLTVMRLGVIAAEARERFGPGSPAWEIAEAARRILLQPAQGFAVTQSLDLLQRKAADELERIDALQRACAVADARAAMLDSLRGAGLVPLSETPVAVGNDNPFGDMISLRRD